MFNDLILKINNFHPLCSCELNFGRNINILGGINGSGKTTLSKLLFCFLTANSDERFNLIISSINNRIFKLFLQLEGYGKDSKYFNKFLSSSLEDNINLDDTIKNFNLLKTIVESSNKNFNGVEKQLENIEKSINIVKNDFDDLYSLVIRYLVQSEFNITLESNNNNSAILYNESDINFMLDYKNNIFKKESYMSISEIIYIDSLSILDGVFNETNNNSFNLNLDFFSY